MELYILDSQFRKVDVIDEYISAIWTERYSDSGDLVLSVAATRENRDRLVEKTFIANPASTEVMMLETVNIEDDILKVTGPTLDKFLATRVIIPANVRDQQSVVYTGTAGFVVNAIVSSFATPGGWTLLYGAVLPLSIDGAKQALTKLVVGAQATGPSQTFSITRGPLYDEIKKHAQAAEIGWKMIPINVSASDYTLEFSTWAGRDLTSAQTANARVRFSSSLDSLADVKELRSIADYRTVAYAIASDFDPTKLTGGAEYTGVAYAYGGANYDIDFNRRVLLVDITGITIDSVNDDFPTFKAVMDGHARDALANNNFTKVIDGEVVPQNEFVYGLDYFLGDMIELQDKYGYIQPARITEYIRSQDANGFREYPTVSVIQ